MVPLPKSVHLHLSERHLLMLKILAQRDLRVPANLAQVYLNPIIEMKFAELELDISTAKELSDYFRIQRQLHL